MKNVAPINEDKDIVTRKHVSDISNLGYFSTSNTSGDTITLTTTNPNITSYASIEGIPIRFFTQASYTNQVMYININSWGKVPIIPVSSTSISTESITIPIRKVVTVVYNSGFGVINGYNAPNASGVFHLQSDNIISGTGLTKTNNTLSADFSTLSGRNYIASPTFSSNVYSIGSLSGITTTAQLTGQAIRLKIPVGGSSTGNVSITMTTPTLTSVAVYKSDGSTRVGSGDWAAGGLYTVVYDGTNFIQQGEGGGGSINGVVPKTGLTTDETVIKGDIVESYYKNWSTSRSALPAPTGGTTSACVAYSDNNYLAVGTNVSPYHAIYSQSGGTVTKLNDATGGNPANTTNGITFSPNATYLAMAHSSTPFLRIYKRSGDAFSLLTTNAPNTIPTGNGLSAAFTSDSQFLAVGHNTSGSVSLSVYQRSGDTFVKLTDLESPLTKQPGNDVTGVAWSSDGLLLACGIAASPWLVMYKRSGTTFTKLTNLTGSTMGGQCWGVAFSPDDNYVAVAHSVTPFFHVFKRTAGTDNYVKLVDGSSFSYAAACRSVAYSPDGAHVTVGIGASPWVSILKQVGDTLTQVASNPTGTIAAGCLGVSYSPDAGYFVTSHSAAGLNSLYTNAGTTNVFRKVLSGSQSIGNFDKIFGVVTQGASAGANTMNANIIIGSSLLP